MGESYEGFYFGGDVGFSPGYGHLTGYNMNAANLGFPGSPQTANQLQDVVNAVKHGTKTFEVTMLQAEVGESIPSQHFEEMRALMKLTGVKPSVHAPVIDSVGWGERGWGKEEAREDSERRLFSAIERAQVLDPSGKLPVVVHPTNGTPGLVWRPGDKSKGEPERVLESGTIVNQETGQAQNVNREFKFKPGHPELLENGGMIEDGKLKVIEGGRPGLLYDVESNVGAVNEGEWSNKLTEVAQMSKHVGEIMGSAPLHLQDYAGSVISLDGKKVFKMGEDGKFQGESEGFSDEDMQHYGRMKKADLFMENAELAFAGAFNYAYKYGTDEQKKALKDLSVRYAKGMEGASDYIRVGEGKRDFGANVMSTVQKQHVLDNSLKELQDITKRNAPQTWKFGEDLALENATKTFGNLAIKSYEKFKDKAPILAIENAYPTQALSDAGSLKKLVESSRKRFVDYLVEEKGFKEKKAIKLAQDKIGVTWDVGHLNMIKSKGFKDEDVLKQTKTITEDKSMVKHVHLTDNFGFGDTHLVPGMGNVPIKDILEELEKTGRFDEMRKITEAGGMVQHFRKLPHSMTLAAFGSGIYGMKNAPTWNQAIELQGSYFGGYGALNPQTHHSYFGAGFTTMPVELGGQMPGGDSRFGGTPMA